MNGAQVDVTTTNVVPKGMVVGTGTFSLAEVCQSKKSTSFYRPFFYGRHHMAEAVAPSMGCQHAGLGKRAPCCMPGILLVADAGGCFQAHTVYLVGRGIFYVGNCPVLCTEVI